MKITTVSYLYFDRFILNTLVYNSLYFSILFKISFELLKTSLQNRPARRGMNVLLVDGGLTQITCSHLKSYCYRI